MFILGSIAEKSESDHARIAAISLLFERGWGKPIQQHAHGGADGEGPIVVEVIHRERERKK